MRAPRLRSNRPPNLRGQRRPHRKPRPKQANLRRRKQHLTASRPRRCSRSNGRTQMPFAQRARPQGNRHHLRIRSPRLCNQRHRKTQHPLRQHLPRLPHSPQPPHQIKTPRRPISLPACPHGGRCSAHSSSPWGSRAFSDSSRSGISDEQSTLHATRPALAATSGATGTKARLRWLRPTIR